MIRSPNFVSSVEKAERRFGSLDTDLAARKEFVRDNPPAALANEVDKRQRRRFLENLYDQSGEGDRAFERIIQGNELQDASFLARGALVARAVMRIVLNRPGGGVYGYGTGFLVGDGVLITNNHVLPRADVAASAQAEVFYERDIYGRDSTTLRFTLDPSTFYTSEDLDFTFTGVAPRDVSGKHQLSDLGWLPLIGGSGKAAEGEWLSIIQHPNGERKQLCVRENQLLKRDTDVLWYSTDTLAGSSGSPVFNNDWLLVALHHSGVPEKRDDKWQTIDGRDYDPVRDSEDRIKWIANEGIRVSRIVETLRTDPAALALTKLQALISTDVHDLRARLPVLYPEGTGPPIDPGQVGPTCEDSPPERGPDPGKDKAMAEKIVTVRLAVDDDGSVRILDHGIGSEAISLDGLLEAKAKQEIVHSPAKPREDWVSGFDTEFLGKGDLRVNLPKVASGKIAPLIDRDGVRCVAELAAFRAKQSHAKRIDAYGHEMNPEEAEAGILHYNNFSVVMNPDRRLAYFVAANMDGGIEWPLGRPDVDWLDDERILPSHQLNDSFYSGSLFDRGHLCRREDLEWGSDKFDVTRRANGTFVHTNCAPQFWKFNRQQGDTGNGLLLWQGLETFLLERIARIGKFKIQVISGPIFGEFDRKFREMPVPFDFWKVVVGINEDKKLFATSFVLSQKEFVEDGSLIRPKEGVLIENMFAKFETFQRPIEEIEKRTGLKFTFGSGAKPKSLADIDRFAAEVKKPVWERRRSSRRPAGGLESLESRSSMPLGGPLTTLEDIVL